MRFVIGALSSKDKTWVWQAYNGMVEYKNILGGKKDGRGEALRLGLCKRLLDKNFNLVSVGYNALCQWKKSVESAEKNDQSRVEKIRKAQERIVRTLFFRIWKRLDCAIRKWKNVTEFAGLRDTQVLERKKGILKRIVDSNARLMGAGFNKLVYEWNLHKANVDKRVRFVLRTLTDADARAVLKAWNRLKQRKAKLDGVKSGGLDLSQKLICKRFINKSFDLKYHGLQRLQGWVAHCLSTEKLRNKV
jgi:hypothetical protein